MSEPTEPVPDRLAELLTTLDDAAPRLAPPPEVDISDLLPTTGNHPTETAQYRTVVLTDIPDPDGSSSARALTGPVDLGETHGLYTRPGEGVVITTQQEWHARGVTLGRLLHSLALAPGESTRVAVVDWTRRDAGRSTDDVSQDEDVTAETDDERRARDGAASRAAQSGAGSASARARSQSSSAASSAGIAGFNWGIGGTAGSAENETMATTVARSASAKEAATTALQDIAARTRQRASAARARQATVIREANQVEGAKASTRVVTNYNHMHAMSVQYYEVVQSYEVRTYPLRIDRCVFVPMAELTFTPDLLRRFGATLAAAAPPDWVDRIAAGGGNATTVTRTRLSGPSRVDGTVAGHDVRIPPGSPGMSELAAAADGTVCGVTVDGRAVRYNPAGTAWVDLPALPGGVAVRHVALARGDDIWAVGATNGVYRLRDGEFVQDPAAYLRELTCAQDGSVLGVGTDEGTYRYRDGEWTNFRDTGWAERVAIAHRDRAWALGTSGKLCPGTTEDWHDPYEDRPGPYKMVAASSDATLFTVTTDNELYQRDADGGAWHAPVFATDDLDRVLWVAPVSAQDVWVLRADGRPVHVSKAVAPMTPFAEKSDDADPRMLEVWSDNDVVRGMRLTFAGSTGTVITCGDTGAGLFHAEYPFDPARPPATVRFDTSRAEGGCVCGVFVDETHALGVPGEPGVPIPLTAATICGLFGEVGTADRGRFVAAAGFVVRTEAAPDAVLRHLNGNRGHYSRAVWAGLDELTRSRVLASFAYTPTGVSLPHPLPLGACVDPEPVAMTGNYLAFRWHYPTEAAREEWLERSGLGEGPSADDPSSVIAVPSAGVFAEAVLGRANAAEKVDLTRFWHWGDSPIPILPPEIATVGMDSRARDMDLTSQGLEAAMAQLQQLRALPDPTGMDAVTRTMVTRLFDDMSKASENAAVALQGLKEAAASEKAAGGRSVDVYKATLEHFQTTLPMMLDAAKQLLPLVAPQLGLASKVAGVFGGDTPTAARGLSPSAAAPPPTGAVALPGATTANGLLSSGTPSSSAAGLLSPAAGPALPGRTITETGGLINIARDNGTASIGRSTTGSGGSASAVAERLLREVGLPALRSALGKDPTLATLTNGRLSDLLSTAIVDELSKGVR